MNPLVLAELPPEKLLQKRIAEALPHALAHIDVHDGRGCPLHHRGIGERDLVPGFGRLFYGLGKGANGRHGEKEPERNERFGSSRSFHGANPV